MKNKWKETEQEIKIKNVLNGKREKNMSPWKKNSKNKCKKNHHLRKLLKIKTQEQEKKNFQILSKPFKVISHSTCEVYKGRYSLYRH